MTDKTQPTTHAEITAPISADLRRIEQSAARAANRDTHFYLAGWNGARGNEDSHEHFRRALQAAPTAPAAVPVLYVSPAQLEKHLDLEGAENAEAGRYLPARKTLAGKFTQPLYAHAPAPAAVAVPAPLAAGMKVAADLVQEQADLYIAEHAETDPDTGAVIWHHREYGFDWHNGLEELAQKLLARAALTAAPAQAVAQGITIDFKQAAELLEMFGGEPAEITLTTGDGHSGNGLYASYTDMPEEGAGFLGTSDDEALPAAPAQEHATQLAGQGQEVTDAMALAFHHAITDGAIGQDDVEEIKTGLRAVLCNVAAPAQAQEDARALEAPAAPEWERVRRGLSMMMMGFASTPGKPLQAAEAALDAATEPGMPLACLRALAAAPQAPEVDALDHAELQEILRAVDQFADCGETDVDYALLMRAAQAGYLECTHFQVMNESALNLDAAHAALGGE